MARHQHFAATAGPDAGVPAPAREKRRYFQIDTIRGIAMVTIALNHYGLLVNEMGAYAFRGITPTLFGFSSAAELFVLVAGVGIGLAGTAILTRSGFRALASWAFRRAAIIWVANIALLTAVIVFSQALQDSLRAKLLVQLGISNGAALDLFRLAETIFLIRNPMLLDILQMYTVFLLVAPLLILAVRTSAAWALFGSVLLWSAVQTWAYADSIRATLPSVVSGTNFDLVAWQLLVVLGIVVATRSMLDRLNPGPAVILAFAGLLVASAVWVILASKAIVAPAALTEKPTLGALRLCHALVYFAFLWGIVSRTRDWLAPLWRAFGLIGRTSLPVFCISTMLAIMLAAVVVSFGSSALFYALYAVLPLLTWLSAYAWQRAFAGKAQG